MTASRTVQRRRVGGSGSCVHVTNVVGKSSEEFPSPAERRTTGERRGGDTCLGKLSALGIIRPDCVVHEDKFSFQYPRIVPRRSLSYARVTFVYYPRRGLSTYPSSRRPTRLRFGCAVFCRRVCGSGVIAERTAPAERNSTLSPIVPNSYKLSVRNVPDLSVRARDFTRTRRRRY